MREHEGPGASCEHQKFGGCAGCRGGDGRDNAGGSRHGHCCRSGGHANERRHGPCEQQRRRVRPERHVGDGAPDAALNQHSIESPTRTDHQQDGRGGTEAVVGELEHLFACEVERVPQRPKREKEGEQESNNRVADELEPCAPWARRFECHACRAGEEHEDHRNHDGKERDAEARHVAHRAAFQLRSQRVLGWQRYSRGDPRGEDGSGQRGGGETDE